MMWSARCRGAAVRADGRSSSREAKCSVYAGEASDMTARSTSERRTLHSRPTRTARRRPVLIQMRTVAGWIFSSALTCGTVSQGSSPATDVLAVASGIRSVDRPPRAIYQLGEFERRRTHNGGMLPGGTAASQMDDQPGKVIDGTARARHWRRSQTEARADGGDSEVRSEAPKGFASSLLVPADMFAGSVAVGESAEEGVSRLDGETGEDGSDHAGGVPVQAAEHQNPFLAPDAGLPVQHRPKRRSPRARMAAAVSVLVGLPEALLARTVRRGSVIHGGGRLVLALSTGAALLAGLIVITLGRGRGDTSRSIQNAPAIAALQQLQGTSFRIALQPAPRSSPHRTHHRASRKQPSRPRARSHVTVARRVTAVAARYTPQASAAGQSTGTSAPVTGGSSTSGSHGSSAAASSTTKSSSSPTAADRAPTRPFGAGGALGPGSSPNG